MLCRRQHLSSHSKRTREDTSIESKHVGRTRTGSGGARMYTERVSAACKPANRRVHCRHGAPRIHLRAPCPHLHDAPAWTGKKVRGQATHLVACASDASVSSDGMRLRAGIGDASARRDGRCIYQQPGQPARCASRGEGMRLRARTVDVCASRDRRCVCEQRQEMRLPGETGYVSVSRNGDASASRNGRCVCKRLGRLVGTDGRVC